MSESGAGSGSAGVGNPLDQYRRKASFSVPALRNFLSGEEVVAFENQVCVCACVCVCTCMYMYVGMSAYVYTIIHILCIYMFLNER